MHLPFRIRNSVSVRVCPVRIVGGRCPLNQSEATRIVSFFQALPESRINVGLFFHVSKNPTDRIQRPSFSCEIFIDLQCVSLHLRFRQILVSYRPAHLETPFFCVSSNNASILDVDICSIRKDELSCFGLLSSDVICSA